MSNHRSSTLFITIHSDVQGPIQNTSLSTHRWFITFIDYCTKLTWVYMLKAKSNVFSTFSQFIKWYIHSLILKLKF